MANTEEPETVECVKTRRLCVVDEYGQTVANCRGKSGDCSLRCAATGVDADGKEVDFPAHLELSVSDDGIRLDCWVEGDDEQVVNAQNDCTIASLTFKQDGRLAVEVNDPRGNPVFSWTNVSIEKKRPRPERADAGASKGTEDPPEA